jgi:hypothetical protein
MVAVAYHDRKKSLGCLLWAAVLPEQAKESMICTWTLELTERLHIRRFCSKFFLWHAVPDTFYFHVPLFVITLRWLHLSQSPNFIAVGLNKADEMEVAGQLTIDSSSGKIVRLL